jgi:secreted trypsin-like serine protease
MKLFTTLAAACALAVAASPAQAVVGGQDAAEGQFPSVANISIDVVVGSLGCTGTLIAPQWVLTAGHCGSVTGEAKGSPVTFPPQLYDVQVGTAKANGPSQYHFTVDQVVTEPKYLATSGYDVSLLHLTAKPAVTPTLVAGASERALWNPGVLETIAGFGVTDEAGNNTPKTLQWARVPIIADQTCADDYAKVMDPTDPSNWDPTAEWDPASMVCAGYPNGGVDTCQGDSGGPLFATLPVASPTPDDLRVVGATSWGEGCAEAGYPGVYARVADAPIRDWLASQVPGSVAGAGTSPAARARYAKQSRIAAKRVRARFARHG